MSSRQERSRKFQKCKYQRSIIRQTAGGENDPGVAFWGSRFAASPSGLTLLPGRP